jgi:hypothetical protein
VFETVSQLEGCTVTSLFTKETTMTIARRQIIGLFATGAATALTGCGGGGSVEVYNEEPPVQVLPAYAWILNLNPDFTALDVDFDGTNVAAALPFQGLTRRVELAPRRYSLGLRNRGAVAAARFDYLAASNVASVEVVYRKGVNAVIDSTPSGLVNYFDSSEPLITELDDGTTSSLVQRNVLAFEGGVTQAANTVNCGLLVRRSSNNAVVYDSGVVRRPDAILLFQTISAVSPVGALGLNYFDDNTATVTLWPNVM